MIESATMEVVLKGKKGGIVIVAWNAEKNEIAINSDSSGAQDVTFEPCSFNGIATIIRDFISGCDQYKERQKLGGHTAPREHTHLEDAPSKVPG